MIRMDLCPCVVKVTLHGPSPAAQQFPAVELTPQRTQFRSNLYVLGNVVAENTSNEKSAFFVGWGGLQEGGGCGEISF